MSFGNLGYHPFLALYGDTGPSLGLLYCSHSFFFLPLWRIWIWGILNGCSACILASIWNGLGCPGIPTILFF